MGRGARWWLVGTIAVGLALGAGLPSPRPLPGATVTLRGGPAESRPIETTPAARGAWREPAFPPGSDTGP